jgi:hypothetical protein
MRIKEAKSASKKYNLEGYMVDSQKMGSGVSSGGQRIDYHGSWAGNSTEESPLPLSDKRKRYISAEGAGSETDYEDTSEKVKAMQDKSVSQVKKHPMKPLYRN